jgi:hypothetical protein
LLGAQSPWDVEDATLLGAQQPVVPVGLLSLLAQQLCPFARIYRVR